jgi:hypothetical protein
MKPVFSKAYSYQLSVSSRFMNKRRQFLKSSLLLGGGVAILPSALRWNPSKEQVTNSDEGESLMKHSFHREAWALEKFM